MSVNSIEKGFFGWAKRKAVRSAVCLAASHRNGQLWGLNGRLADHALWLKRLLYWRHNLDALVNISAALSGRVRVDLEAARNAASCVWGRGSDIEDVGVLMEAAHPKRIIVFGSRARGDRFAGDGPVAPAQEAAALAGYAVGERRDQCV